MSALGRELPNSADCADLALVLRTPDPLDDHPEVQQRWLALMRKYPGKNALDMAADFLEHLTSAKDCCYNTHADDCPNGHGALSVQQSEDSESLMTITRTQFREAYRKIANVYPNQNSERFTTQVLAELGVTIVEG